MAAPVAAVAKKALEIFASNKKGRKLLGYAIAVALFLILLPVLLLHALFGGIAVNGDFTLLPEGSISSLSADQQERIMTIDIVNLQIAEEFLERGLPENDKEKAQEIYAGLMLIEDWGENFVVDFIGCFENASEETPLYDNLSNRFSLFFSEEAAAYLDDKYGVTIGRMKESYAD